MIPARVVTAPAIIFFFSLSTQSCFDREAEDDAMKPFLISEKLQREKDYEYNEAISNAND